MAQSYRPNDQSRQYFNTLVFAVVSGIVSIALLVMVLSASQVVQRFNAFIITVEVGLLLVIGIAIYRIVVFERRRSKSARDGYQQRLKLSTCPDYWTAMGNTCKNSFIDPYDRDSIYYVNGTSADIPEKNLLRFINRSDYNNRMVPDVCKDVREKVKAPWTDVTSVCDSYRIASIEQS